MKITLLRHATLLLSYAGFELLVDPMLAAAGSMEPVANAADSRRIPLVELSISAEQLQALIQDLDALLLTHTHRDHWDAAAQELLPKGLPIFCQPPDADRLRAAGFLQIMPVEKSLDWMGLSMTRTAGEHGTGEIGKRMAPVSGFVLRASGEPGLYIAGDTIWCPAVAQALAEHMPEVVVVNAGEARFLQGDPITMSAADVLAVRRAVPQAQVVAVHLESVNHCWMTRPALRLALEAGGAGGQVWIPADGEAIEFNQ